MTYVDFVPGCTLGPGPDMRQIAARNTHRNAFSKLTIGGANPCAREAKAKISRYLIVLEAAAFSEPCGIASIEVRLRHRQCYDSSLVLAIVRC